jgi:hypothetical protein
VALDLKVEPRSASIKEPANSPVSFDEALSSTTNRNANGKGMTHTVLQQISGILRNLGLLSAKK